MDVKKDLAIGGGLFLIVVILIVFGGGYTSLGGISDTESSRSANTQSDIPFSQEEGKTRVRVKSLDITAEVANSNKLRKKGLGGRESLPISQGILFVFEQPKVYTFWMKDVEFPIDIIWIDSDKRIVDIVLNAQPEPKTDDEDLKRYKPSNDALYVLEINAGLAAANSLLQGDVVDFSL